MAASTPVSAPEHCRLNTAADWARRCAATPAAYGYVLSATPAAERFVCTLCGAGVGTAAYVAVGAITGNWARAAAGAAIGAGAGYLSEQERQHQAAAPQ